MAGITTNSPSEADLELLDQALEDIAGEEISDFDDDLFELETEFDTYSEVDHFAEIDSLH